jgi:drug/metabolite transporter (DMT)-like permease
VIGILLAALSGLVWGAGDFSGGKASQRADALLVVMLSKAASLPLLALYMVLMPAGARATAIGWGAVAGVFGVIGMFAFYRALSGGAMAIVAPISAVAAALLPVVFGLAAGERPGALALTGAACAIAAIGLVSAAGGTGTKVTRALVGLALLSGAAFGLFFTSLSRAGDDAGLWPVAGAQAAAIVFGAPLLAHRLRRGAARPAGPSVRWLLAAGVLDMTANALYLLAASRGDLSIVAPIASLYPVSTVLLAMAVDRERLRAVQLAGLGLAATALVLVAS